jgi:hypothetical protein
MAFTHKLPEAAHRHLQAADILCADPGHRKDVAGYLYGIAAECAIKQMVIPLSLPPQYDKDYILRRTHFPKLRIMLRDALGQRKGIPLRVFIADDAFMNNWHVKMRYADARQILPEWVDAWQRQARAAVNAMGA